MARIKIEDLPVMEELKTDELKGIFGGVMVPPQKFSFFGGFEQRGVMVPPQKGGGFSFAKVAKKNLFAF